MMLVVGVVLTALFTTANVTIAAVRQLLQERRNSWIISLDISDTFFPAKMAHTNIGQMVLEPRG